MNIFLEFPPIKGKIYLIEKYKLIESKLSTLFKNIIEVTYNSNSTNYVKLTIKNFETASILENAINNIRNSNIKLLDKYSTEQEVFYHLDFDYNLLIIGNGFDIAHGLNTQYTDFLNVFNKDIVIINNHEHNMESNCIYLYLKEQKNKNGYWTDVEKAIIDIIKSLEKIKMTFIDSNTYKRYTLETLLDKKYYDILNTIKFFPKPKNNRYPQDYKFTNNNFCEFIKKLEADLDSFINALEDYLLGIENTSVDNLIHLNDINNIKDSITHILSFNYTDTFRKLYINDISDENIDFIHGRLGKHNLVLGISETLDNEQENLELSCIYFKKYFQRIFKKTGAKYADWLSNDSGSKFDTAYIYGHSLDITDKEILSRIINDTHVKKIVIFYHNEAHYRQEISNLVKILDKNIFLKYVAEHRIEFKEQSS